MLVSLPRTPLKLSRTVSLPTSPMVVKVLPRKRRRFPNLVLMACRQKRRVALLNLQTHRLLKLTRMMALVLAQNLLRLPLHRKVNLTSMYPNRLPRSGLVLAMVNSTLTFRVKPMERLLPAMAPIPSVSLILVKMRVPAQTVMKRLLKTVPAVLKTIFSVLLMA